jgi:hypothetical protein
MRMPAPVFFAAALAAAWLCSDLRARFSGAINGLKRRRALSRPNVLDEGLACLLHPRLRCHKDGQRRRVEK